MKKLILFIFLPLTLIFAQTEEEKPIDLSGKFALMFQIDQNFDLNSFDGMSFAGKYFYNNFIGGRIVFSVNTGKKDSKQDIEEPSTNYTSNQIITSTHTEYTVGFSFLFNLIQDNSFMGFFGIGPYYSLYKHDQSTEQLESLIKTNAETESYGIEFIAGFEWFVLENLSLGAEYGLAYKSEISTHEKIQIFEKQIVSQTFRKDDYSSIYGTEAKLSISIYF